MLLLTATQQKAGFLWHVQQWEGDGVRVPLLPVTRKDSGDCHKAYGVRGGEVMGELWAWSVMGEGGAGRGGPRRAAVSLPHCEDGLGHRKAGKQGKNKSLKNLGLMRRVGHGGRR